MRDPVFPFLIFAGQNFSPFADIQIYSNVCECRLTGMPFKAADLQPADASVPVGSGPGTDHRSLDVDSQAMLRVVYPIENQPSFP